MRGLRDGVARAACAIVVAGLVACSGATPQAPDADPPTEVTASVLLAGINAALDSGDAVEATRLADLAREADLTDEQTSELAALVARAAEADPTGGVDPAGDTLPTHAAPSLARASRGRGAAAAPDVAYDAVPFFDGYRDESDGSRSAWYDLGALYVSSADAPAPGLHRRGARGDVIVVLDLGQLLSEKGIDETPRRYHGVTRVRHGAMLHHYVDAFGRVTTGRTSLQDDGATHTTLLRRDQ